MLRPLIGLLGIAGLLVALQSGVFTTLAVAVGEALGNVAAKALIP